jgi:nicotinamide mononucleotide transporter
MSLLSTEFIVVSLLGYPISLIELIATLFGYLSVFLAVRQHVFTWPTGILNEVALFVLFFQVQLYADMLLQCVFFVFTVYGWLQWNNSKKALAVKRWGAITVLQLLSCIVLLAFLLSLVVRQFHLWLPDYFEHPAAHPFIDSLVCLLSIAAILLLAFKILESWILWIIVDVLSIGLFAAQEIYLVAIAIHK